MGSGSRVRSSATTSQSFTQLVSNASRASCAVSTASAAVRHPAVLGSTPIPSRRNRSSTPVWPAASTRRMATVVSSVPDATSARSSTERFDAPPVPVISRDPELASRDDQRIVHVAASLHGGEHFHDAAFGHRGRPAHAARGTTVPSSATATPDDGAPVSSTRRRRRSRRPAALAASR